MDDSISSDDVFCNNDLPLSGNERLIRAYCQEHDIDFNLFCQKSGMRFQSGSGIKANISQAKFVQVNFKPPVSPDILEERILHQKARRCANQHKRRARKKASKGSYTPQQLQDQMQRQKSKCYYCKVKLDGVWQADHVVPLSRGGSNDINNIVIACPKCNWRKHARLPHEWPEGGRLL